MYFGKGFMQWMPFLFSITISYRQRLKKYTEKRTIEDLERVD